MLIHHVQGRVRLRVLVALEGRERSSAQLMAELGEPFDPINNALRALVGAGLVELLRREPATAKGNTLRKVYTARKRGWGALAKDLDRHAARLLPDDDDA
jgi:hypothetical protein